MMRTHTSVLLFLKNYRHENCLSSACSRCVVFIQTVCATIYGGMWAAPPKLGRLSLIFFRESAMANPAGQQRQGSYKRYLFSAENIDVPRNTKKRWLEKNRQALNIHHHELNMVSRPRPSLVSQVPCS